MKSGAVGGIRTHDLLVGNETLYQTKLLLHDGTLTVIVTRPDTKKNSHNASTAAGGEPVTFASYDVGEA